jgi:hypothetical protein
MSVRRWIRARRERGQVLIIIAVALVGLLALAGLAIDGGNLFMERRRAQNAADAGALAGTRLISLAMMTCDPIDMSGLDAKIARVVNEYAEGNGISDTNGVPGDEVNDNIVAYYVNSSETRLGTVGAMGTVPMGTSGVEVELRDQHRTYFLLVVGIPTIPSSAQAMAMTGVVRQWPGGAGLIPIAVPEVVVDDILAGTDWEMFDTSPDKTKEGKFCYDRLGEEVCIEGPDSPVNALRGWLNLNHNFNNEFLDPPLQNRTFDKNVSNDGCKDPLPGLRGYASGDCPYDYPIYAGHSCYTDPDPLYCPDGENCLDGDFIHGDPGSRSSSLMDLYDGYEGETAYAPVFDKVYLREYMVDTFDPQAAPPEGFEHSGGGFSSAAGGSGDSWYYHVVGYVATWIPEGTSNNKVLYGEFIRAPIGAGEIIVEEYDGSCSLLMHGVTLWR